MVYFNNIKKGLPIVLLFIGILFLYLGNPETNSWFPKCYFYVFTGLECPACGTQRALHQFLHFNFIQAFRYNPFLLISLPYFFALVWVQWFDNKKRLKKLRTFCHHTRTIQTYLVLTIIWWIGRNIF